MLGAPSGSDMEAPSGSDIGRGLVVEELYRTKKPRIIADLQESPWSENRIAKAGYRGSIIIPILQGNECYAHMRLDSKKANVFTEKDEKLLTAIADHLAPAIRNAALFQAVEDRASRFATLNDLGQQIAQNLELDEVLASIAQASVKLTRGDKSRRMGIMMDPL